MLEKVISVKNKLLASRIQDRDVETEVDDRKFGVE
jgi:hypothetical protein